MQKDLKRLFGEVLPEIRQPFKIYMQKEAVQTASFIMIAPIFRLPGRLRYPD